VSNIKFYVVKQQVQPFPAAARLSAAFVQKRGNFFEIVKQNMSCKYIKQKMLFDPTKIQYKGDGRSGLLRKSYKE